MEFEVKMNELIGTFKDLEKQLEIQKSLNEELRKENKSIKAENTVVKNNYAKMKKWYDKFKELNGE